jgi:hypothetical protein
MSGDDDHALRLASAASTSSAAAAARHWRAARSSPLRDDSPAAKSPQQCAAPAAGAFGVARLRPGRFPAETAHAHAHQIGRGTVNPANSLCSTKSSRSFGERAGRQSTTGLP